MVKNYFDVFTSTFSVRLSGLLNHMNEEELPGMLLCARSHQLDITLLDDEYTVSIVSKCFIFVTCVH